MIIIIKVDKKYKVRFLHVTYIKRKVKLISCICKVRKKNKMNELANKFHPFLCYFCNKEIRNESSQVSAKLKLNFHFNKQRILFFWFVYCCFVLFTCSGTHGNLWIGLRTVPTKMRCIRTKKFKEETFTRMRE